MKIEDKIIGHISIRSLCTIILMIGAFFVVHGYIRRLVVGGHLSECVMGIVISIIAIILAAIPSQEQNLPSVENNKQEKK